MTAIYMKHWLEANGRARVLPTDKWYLDFAAGLLPLVGASALFGREAEYVQRGAAVSLSMYFQDAIAQSGGWSAFTEFHRRVYGTYLPFYPPTGEYVPDEINREDIAFVLWTLKSRIGRRDGSYTLFSPYDPDLMSLSRSVYARMDERFEEAPICETASPPCWLTGPEMPKMPLTPLPESVPDARWSRDAARCLAYSQGRPLLYFADYRELCGFFVGVLGWDDSPSALLPDLAGRSEFVVYANAKGMLIAHGVAACFCEAHNPMYDARRAAAEGYRMFCQPGHCPFDLLKYGMAKGVLPDVALPFLKGKETLQQYGDFIARYYLREYYEGE